MVESLVEMMRGFILFTLAVPLLAQTDFAVHDMTNDFSHGPYVASSSSVGAGQEAYQAFDGNNSSEWLGGAPTQWIQFAITDGSQASLNSYVVRFCDSDPSRAPKNWTIQGANYDTPTTFTTVDTQTNQTSWSNPENRTFTPASSVKYSIYRMNITANNGSGSFVGVCELTLNTTGTVPSPTNVAPVNMTTNLLPTPYVASASTEFPNGSATCNTTTATNGCAYRAFQGTTITNNVAWFGNNNGVDNLNIDLGTGNAFHASAYTFAGDPAQLGRLMRAWTFQGSNDNSTWTTLDTQSLGAGCSGGYGGGSAVVQQSLPSTYTATFRYFRLNITSNCTGGTFTEVTYLQVWQKPATLGAQQTVTVDVQ